MEEEDVDYTKKTSSVLLLPNNSGSSESYYDTNNYKQVDGRNISNERVNIRQSSLSKTNSRSKFCWKICCSPEWRRISKKSIIISFFLFFGGLVSIIRGILAVSLTGNLNIFYQAIFLSGLVIYFKSRQSKGSEFLILGSISK